MKPRWQVKNLAEVASIIAGQSPEGSAYNDLGKGLPFYQGKKEFGARFIGEPTTWTTQITKVAVKGDILMSVRAPVGPVNFATEKCCIGRGLAAIRSQNGLNRDFLYYFLLREQDEISGKEGAVFPSISKTEIEKIPIPHPPQYEQERIVSVLDQAFAAIATAKANAEKNLLNTHTLFQNYLDTSFSQQSPDWTEEELSSLCDIKHGFAFDGADFSAYVPDGNPIVITPGNFTEDGLLQFNASNTKRFRGKSPKDFCFELGDLVVVMTDLSSKMKILGKPAFVETENVLHNQRIGRVLFRNGRVEKRLVYYFLMTSNFLKNIKGSATGTMVKHTAPKRILSNIIPFPEDKKKQRTIVTKLDSLRADIRDLESAYRQKIAALEDLKKSILHQAFTGSL